MKRQFRREQAKPNLQDVTSSFLCSMGNPENNGLDSKTTLLQYVNRIALNVKGKQAKSEGGWFTAKNSGKC